MSVFEFWSFGIVSEFGFRASDLRFFLLFFEVLFFEGLNFIQSLLVPSSSKGGIQPYLDDLLRQFSSNDSTSDDQDIGVCMLLAEPGRVEVVDQSCPYAPEFVGDNGHPNTSPTDENPLFQFSFGNFLSHEDAIVRIVNGFLIEGPEIDGLKPCRFQKGLQFLFELKTAVVTGQPDLHDSIL